MIHSRAIHTRVQIALTSAETAYYKALLTIHTRVQIAFRTGYFIKDSMFLTIHTRVQIALFSLMVSISDSLSQFIPAYKLRWYSVDGIKYDYTLTIHTRVQIALY